MTVQILERYREMGVVRHAPVHPDTLQWCRDFYAHLLTGACVLVQRHTVITDLSTGSYQVTFTIQTLKPKTEA